MIRRSLFLIALIVTVPAVLRAADDESVDTSTPPIGSSFYRHLAADMNMDIRDLVKFERRGFGRTEIVTLALISKSSGTIMRELGKRRIKDQVTLKKLAEEAGLEYDTLYRLARIMKTNIEAKGDGDLPPPVYEEVQTDAPVEEIPPPEEVKPEPKAKQKPEPERKRYRMRQAY